MYGIGKNAHLSQIKELKIRATALKGYKGAHNRDFRWMNLFESDTVKEEYLEQERILLSNPCIPCDGDGNTRWDTFTNEHRLSFRVIYRTKTVCEFTKLYCDRYHAIAWEMTDRQ